MDEESNELYTTIGRLYMELLRMKSHMQQARSVLDNKDKEIAALKEQLAQDDTIGEG